MSGEMKRDALILMLLGAIMIGWLLQRVDRGAVESGPISSTALLNSAPEDFRRVTGPVPLAFPADHGLHPGYRNEWWYFTGNLIDEDGRRYGFQYTLFRFALPDASAQDSDFATEALWMGHLAVSDLDGRRFFNAERFGRDALGLAGADQDLWWLRDWEVRRDGDSWHLQAGFDPIGLDLSLKPLSPIVLQGEAGYSRKGPEPGNASRYYSITRIDVSGALILDGEPRRVRGLAWLDREWGSSQLGAGIAGWDWFALQLDDGRDLMLYRLRTEDGRASPFSAGVLVQPDGSYRVLQREDFELRPRRWWRDDEGVEWPVAWSAELPLAGLALEVEAVFDAQRWNTTVAYWEGAVQVRNAADGAALGRGYLELSGYAEGGPPR
ncbi:MAG: carotenoid 1,2-hydratase [Gammaproteobacteria bacterium HGW-Gammaproteobacteria-8]|nr:MAG: carotenoid 1,2-hydratase [Gammaproteobacteria bacterium HGW-Gammaproteobacteria-8]